MISIKFIRKLQLTIVAFVVALVLSSCDDRGNFIGGLNSAPELSFVMDGEPTVVLSDSIKLSVKVAETSYSFEVLLADINNNAKTLFAIPSSTHRILVNGVDASDGIDVANQRFFSIEVFSEAPGRKLVELLAIDDFGMEVRLVGDIVFFQNLSPVASLEVSRIGFASALHYELNASSSYDRDAMHGGRVLRYIYQINDKIFESYRDKIDFIFPTPGKYEVSLTVIDNNEVASETFRDVIDID